MPEHRCTCTSRMRPLACHSAQSKQQISMQRLLTRLFNRRLTSSAAHKSPPDIFFLYLEDNEILYSFYYFSHLAYFPGTSFHFFLHKDSSVQNELALTALICVPSEAFRKQHAGSWNLSCEMEECWWKPLLISERYLAKEYKDPKTECMIKKSTVYVFYRIRGCVTLQNESQNVEELQLAVLHVCLDVFTH